MSSKVARKTTQHSLNETEAAEPTHRLSAANVQHARKKLATSRASPNRKHAVTHVAEMTLHHGRNLFVIRRKLVSSKVARKTTQHSQNEIAAAKPTHRLSAANVRHARKKLATSRASLNRKHAVTHVVGLTQHRIHDRNSLVIRRKVAKTIRVLSPESRMNELARKATRLPQNAIAKRMHQLSVASVQQDRKKRGASVQLNRSRAMLLVAEVAGGARFLAARAMPTKAPRKMMW